MRDERVSNLKRDERIVFITTSGWQAADGQTWNIPIHAWVHELETATLRRASIAAAMKLAYGLETSTSTRDNFERRARLIAADNERNKRLVIRLGNDEYELPPTAPNGHVLHTLQLDSSLVANIAADGCLQYSAVLPSQDQRRFHGSVRLVAAEGVSVISDFDDTVKITCATDRPRMMDNTLFQDYQSVPGMAQYYTDWVNRGAELHFVSSSPWHLYEPFQEFLQEAGFPSHSMVLRHFRLKDRTLANLFLPGTRTKPAQIKPILTAFPGRRFLLIGDSGQHDPEVYAGIAREFPEQIRRICIRNVTHAERHDARFSEVFADVADDRWMLFDDAAELNGVW